MKAKSKRHSGHDGSVLARNGQKSKEDQEAEADKTLREIQNYSREPFRKILCDLVLASPPLEDLKIFGKKSPDRLAQSLILLGKLSGYTEKTEVNNNYYLNIGSCSDAELLQKIEELEARLKIGKGNKLPMEEAEVVEVTPRDDGKNDKGQISKRPKE